MASRELTLPTSNSAPGPAAHPAEKPKKPGKRVVRVVVVLLVVGLAAAGARAWLWPNAKRNYKRQSSLAELNAAAQQVADDAEAAAAVAVARRNANKALLDLAIAGPRKEDIAEARAILKNYEAQLALAQTELTDASLYAPNNGVIQETKTRKETA